MTYHYFKSPILIRNQTIFLYFLGCKEVPGNKFLSPDLIFTPEVDFPLQSEVCFMVEQVWLGLVNLQREFVFLMAAIT